MASNGAEALELLRAGARPALILLDLMMPILDGFEFLEQQKLDPTLAAIPVVIMSADSNTKVKAAAVSAAGYLQKPFKLELLFAAVDKFATP